MASMNPPRMDSSLEYSATRDSAAATSGGLAHDETASLIASDKVEGTAVYRSNGDRIGRIETIMLDKRSGDVAYAVMSFGGFLGMGSERFPIPWSLLSYNEDLGGYEVNVSDDQLKNAPKYTNESDWDWDDAQTGRDVYDYYGIVPWF
jgi:sporulation protein YlmC with PRC-barrel domain